MNREVDRLVAKYRSEAAEYGVEPDLRGLYRYFARSHRRAGRRFSVSDVRGMALAHRCAADCYEREASCSASASFKPAPGRTNEASRHGASIRPAWLAAYVQCRPCDPSNGEGGSCARPLAKGRNRGDAPHEASNCEGLSRSLDQPLQRARGRSPLSGGSRRFDSAWSGIGSVYILALRLFRSTTWRRDRGICRRSALAAGIIARPCWRLRFEGLDATDPTVSVVVCTRTVPRYWPSVSTACSISRPGHTRSLSSTIVPATIQLALYAIDIRPLCVGDDETRCLASTQPRNHRGNRRTRRIHGRRLRCRCPLARPSWPRLRGSSRHGGRRVCWSGGVGDTGAIPFRAAGGFHRGVERRVFNGAWDDPVTSAGPQEQVRTRSFDARSSARWGSLPRNSVRERRLDPVKIRTRTTGFFAAATGSSSIPDGSCGTDIVETISGFGLCCSTMQSHRSHSRPGACASSRVRARSLREWWWLRSHPTRAVGNRPGRRIGYRCRCAGGTYGTVAGPWRLRRSVASRTGAPSSAPRLPDEAGEREPPRSMEVTRVSVVIPSHNRWTPSVECSTDSQRKRTPLADRSGGRPGRMYRRER